MSEGKLLSEKELATRWGVTQRTIQKWRAEGIGPRWTVLGKSTVRYRLDDVLAYEAERVTATEAEPDQTQGN